jgi:hypothetical protein
MNGAIASLRAFDQNDGSVNAIIETPKGCVVGTQQEGERLLREAVKRSENKSIKR